MLEKLRWAVVAGFAVVSASWVWTFARSGGWIPFLLAVLFAAQAIFHVGLARRIRRVHAEFERSGTFSAATCRLWWAVPHRALAAEVGRKDVARWTPISAGSGSLSCDTDTLLWRPSRWGRSRSSAVVAISRRSIVSVTLRRPGGAIARLDLDDGRCAALCADPPIIEVVERWAQSADAAASHHPVAADRS